MATTRTVLTLGGLTFGGSAVAWQPNFAASGGALTFGGEAGQLQAALVENVSLSIGIVAAVSTKAAIENESAVWGITTKLSGADVSSKLLESITIEHSENAARVADLVFLPDAGLLVPESYPGKRIEIAYNANSESALVFAGIVDSFDLDANDGVLKLKCSDGFQTNMEAASRQQIDGLTVGAFWSKWVFDENAQGWQYAQDRLSTVTNEIHLSVTGAYESASMFAKGVADYTFAAGDIIDKSLNIEVAQRSQIVNDYRIIFEYRFPLLKQQNLSITVTGLNDEEIWCQGYRIPNKDMLTQIADSLDLHNPSISTVDLEAAGTFTCGSTTGIFRNNAVGQLIKSGSIHGSRRMVQTITEKYQLSVTAPDSIAVYGPLVQNDNAGGEVEFDSNAWANFDIGPETTTQVAMTTQGDDGRSAASGAIVCLLQRASATIKKSHRSTMARFSVAALPLISLNHTVAINAGGVVAKGKVSRFTHRFDFESGSASTAIEAAISKLPTAAAIDSALTAPGAPTLPAYGNFGAGGTTIPTYKDDPEDHGSGFYTHTKTNPNDVSFRMQAVLPAVPADTLDPKTLGKTANYTVALVSDSFSITA